MHSGINYVTPKGMLVRYLLEKCKTTKEAIEQLQQLPIASAQTVTIVDKYGEIAVVECNPEHVVVIKPEEGELFCEICVPIH